jgi:hypothetical protein
MNNFTTRELTNEELQQRAPSIFAGQPYSGQSSRYTFIPTSDIIDEMRKNGFVPVSAQQSSSRIVGKELFTKHLIRFRQMNLNVTSVGEYILEAVMSNAHDGTSTYDLSCGVFRVRCLNGLIVAEATCKSVKIRHTGNILDRVIEETNNIMGQAPKIAETIGKWQGIQLTDAQALQMAVEAHAARFEDSPLAERVTPASLLAARRYDDNKQDLWTVLNRIQENVIRGGVRGERLTSNERRIRTREVKSIDNLVNLNQVIWASAERMAAA